MIGSYGPARRRRNAAIAAGLACLVGAAAPAPPVRLLVLGDSLAAGYGLPHEDGFEAQLAGALRGRGENVTIIDAAVSGDTSAGGLARLDWVLGGGADAAIVELGANDGLRGLSPAEMCKNLTAILDTLVSHHIPVLLAGMYAPPNLGPEYEKEYRKVFDALGRRPGVIYDPFFLQGVAEVPSLTQPDGLHPNAAGVRAVVAHVLPDVQKVIAEAKRG